jgi:hypothetical protein
MGMDGDPAAQSRISPQIRQSMVDQTATRAREINWPQVGDARQSTGLQHPQQGYREKNQCSALAQPNGPASHAAFSLIRARQ